MTETKNTGDKTLTAKPKTLSLKRPVEQGVVRQSFSHGRSKAVVVEKIKRRGATASPAVETKAETPVARPKTVQITKPGAQTPSGRAPRASAEPATTDAGQAAANAAGVVLRTLTDEERDARARALVDARGREEELRRQAEIDSKVRSKREAEEKAEREAAEARLNEENQRRQQELDAKQKAETEASRRFGEKEGTPPDTSAPGDTPPPKTTMTLANQVKRPASAPASMEAEESGAKKIIRRPGMPTKVVQPPRSIRGGQMKQRGRLTVSNATSEQDERTRSVASFRRRTQRLKGAAAQPKEKLAREVILPETITIQELASRMSERGVDVIRLLMKEGEMHKITDVIDADTAELVATELGHTVKRVAESDIEEGLFDTPDEEDDNLEDRPAVVTIMGHVDHGKTSLLDAIRSADVVAGEAGGITQHIGAYQVKAPNGDLISFIDTPGHAAFTAMRARGAKVTDIVVLVVAADDGIMPQTIEAIAHARAAEVPMIVAINKIDRPDANPDRVRNELLQHEVQVETMGGETLEIEVSATQHKNIDKLLEAIALQAELLELKANPDRSAEGTVIEALLDRGRGPVATVLVQRGTLHTGDIIVAGSQWGRARALIDDTGNNRDSAGPSMPVEVLGFSGAPDAGDRMAVVESEARAREITGYRERQKREQAAVRGSTARGSLTDMMSQLQTSDLKEIPLVLKGDVQGSVEAIVAALEKMNTDEVAARVIHAGVGGISESDVTLAEASGAIVIGFNVRAHPEARDLAARNNLEVRYYNIIYNLVDDVKDAMSGMLSPTLREDMLGNAEILEVFNISKVGRIAGCRVTDGRVERGANVRLIRDNVVIHEGTLSTLKRFKDEVREVQSGQECGMGFENYQDLRQGDVIECYRVKEIARTLE